MIDTDTGEPLWDQGVGGAQCESCYRITIVTATARDWMGEPTEWLCRACFENWSEDDA